MATTWRPKDIIKEQETAVRRVNRCDSLMNDELLIVLHPIIINRKNKLYLLKRKWDTHHSMWRSISVFIFGRLQQTFSSVCLSETLFQGSHILQVDKVEVVTPIFLSSHSMTSYWKSFYRILSCTSSICNVVFLVIASTTTILCFFSSPSWVST